jgi:hypothetical protein
VVYFGIKVYAGTVHTKEEAASVNFKVRGSASQGILSNTPYNMLTSTTVTAA